MPDLRLDEDKKMSDYENVITYHGEAIKALDDGKIGGYLIRFTDDESPDLEGEFFTKDTDFGGLMESPVWFNHRQPLPTKGGDFIAVKERIGDAVLSIDDHGVLVEAVLYNREQYEEMLDKLGWSSGTASHLIERESVGKAVWLKQWLLGLDASLTPIPAEPSNRAVPLKSWQPSTLDVETQAEGAGDAPPRVIEECKTEPQNKKTEDKNMTEDTVTVSVKDLRQLIREETGEEPPDPMDPNVKAHLDRLDAGLKRVLEIIESSPQTKDAGYVAPDSEEDHPEAKSLGDFLVAVRNGNVKRLQTVYKSTKDTKAALAEDSGATGGYLVPPDYVDLIMAGARPFSVLRMAGATVIPIMGREAKIPVVDVETAPSAGDTAFAGGVVATWEPEAAALAETEPTFKEVSLVPHKLSGYSLASNEMRADSPESLDALLATMFGRAVGSKENYAFLRGDGVGKPKGILESGAWSAQTRSAASTVALADLALMMSAFVPEGFSNGAWFCNPDVLQELIALVSNPLSWVENLRNAPVPPTLMNMPLYVTGALPALNTAGDIMLVEPTYYLIGDKGGMTVAFSEHYRFVNDQGTWRFVHRVDGQPWIDGTITLENASTTVSPFVGLAAG